MTPNPTPEERAKRAIRAQETAQDDEGFSVVETIAAAATMTLFVLQQYGIGKPGKFFHRMMAGLPGPEVTRIPSLAQKFKSQAQAERFAKNNLNGRYAPVTLEAAWEWAIANPPPSYATISSIEAYNRALAEHLASAGPQ